MQSGGVPTRRPPRTKSPVEQLDDLRRYFEALASDHGQRVRSRRKALGLTLDQLAGLVGVPMQTLSKVERGEIVARPYLEAALCLHLHIEHSELFPAPTLGDLLKAVA